jgi:hypothetical protein
MLVVVVVSAVSQLVSRQTRLPSSDLQSPDGGREGRGGGSFRVSLADGKFSSSCFSRLDS